MTQSPQIQRWQCDNIHISHAFSTFEGFTSFKAQQNDQYVRLHFGLKGDYSFHHKQLGQTYDLIGGHHNIMFSNGFDIEVHNKSLVLETFGINFPKENFIRFTQGGNDMLTRFASNILENKPCMLSQRWGSVSKEIEVVIDQILRNRFEGRMADIFLMAKCMELLVLCVDNYQKAEDSIPLYIKSKSDKESIIAARDYINQNLQSPPSLSDIAKTVGINEFKLKHGFKETFGSTVFNYLTDRRLNLAHHVILDSDKTIAEVSTMFGYSSPQHFSAQFRKKFGCTPKSVRNNP